MKITNIILILIITLFLNLNSKAQSINVFGPSGSQGFGTKVVALPSGNFVVTDPSFDLNSSVLNVGAVYLYNGSTGQLISSLKGSTSGDQIGADIVVLANGNFVVESRFWDNGGIVDAGAVTRCSGTTGCSGVVSPSNSLVGTRTLDFVGSSPDLSGTAASGVKALPNGNYIVGSAQWNSSSAERVGAVTFCNGTTGCVGPVSETNSVVGSSADDRIGNGANGNKVIVLPNSNYVIVSLNWDNGAAVNAGAITFGSGSTGVNGIVSAGNSLVGTTSEDTLGSGGLSVLTNGNYVISSPNWNNGNITDAGAVTFGNGANGIAGTISASNSVIGITENDQVGSGKVTALTNGNYTFSSPFWDNGATANSGAATFGSGVNGIVGTISQTNSIIGASENNNVGSSGITALTNGNYVVNSPGWDSSSTFNIGAATWCNGTNGCIGQVTAANSLIGSTVGDQVGLNGTKALTNGNYVVISSEWNNGGNFDAGAATFGNGTTGMTGIVSITNSLTSNSAGDNVGKEGVIALTNGNYVVRTPFWDNTGVSVAGAVTFGNGTTGVAGAISANNSLIGSVPDDRVGNFGVIALANGNYVVISTDWDKVGAVNAGAVTFGNGTNGTVGTISAANSLVGTDPNDRLGRDGVTALTNGNYVVNDDNWDSATTSGVGAVAFCNGTIGTVGTITPQNSLIGSSAFDRVGNGGVTPLPDGNYVVKSGFYDKMGTTDVGAITIGNGVRGTVGLINSSNSVIGSRIFGGSAITFDYNQTNNQLIVGRPFDNIVTLFRVSVSLSLFDFDGDGKSDISVFRPSNGVWYLNQSQNGFAGITFGQNGDLIAPADFDGDGRTDVAVFRPSNGTWYILNSSNNSFSAAQFGANGDLPRPADFDGDGKSDISLFRPSNGAWYRINSSNGSFYGNIFGQNGDKPLVADYDGDGKSDLAVFRPSTNTFYWLTSANNGFNAAQFGLSTDIPTPGDFDGDGKTDIAVFRPSNGSWYRINSSNGSFAGVQFGASGDIPATGDYDGDGKSDIAVFRPTNGAWYYTNSSNGGFVGVSFGISTDKPVPAAFQ